MSLHNQYRKDAEAVWVRPTPTIEMLVTQFDARAPEYINIMARVTKPVRKMVEHNLLNPEQDRKYATMGFIEYSLKNWRTIVREEDKEGPAEYRPEINVKDDEWLSFTPENALRVFVAYPAFYLDVFDLARDLKSFQVGDNEVKNSQPV